MPTGGLSGADSVSASKGSAPPSPSNTESAAKAGSYSRADRQAKTSARKPDSKPEERPANAENGHGATVDEQGQKLRDFDKVQGRLPLGERSNSNGRNEGALDTASCAAGAAKDVVVDTVSGAYHSIKDAGGAVLDQAGVDGYEDHTQRTVERGEAAWDGAKNAGRAAMSPIETAGRVKNAAKAEFAEIQAEFDKGESCKLAERVGGALGHAATAVVPGGAIIKGGKALKAMSKLDGGEKADVPEAKTEVNKAEDVGKLGARPKVQVEHILDGEINSKGKAVGYHHRVGGSDAPSARMTEQTETLDTNDVYKGKVEVHDPSSGQWVAKKAESTFYPDKLSRREAVEAIENAWDNKANFDNSSGRFEGPSGHGFNIVGFARDGEIKTAYPDYQE